MTIIDLQKDLSGLFSQQVRATPDAVALEDDTITYTYGELDTKTNALAQRLLSFGVETDRLVGVLLPRSAKYVIACLAALRAGGAFLVLETAYPPDLLADVIDDSKPAVIITCKSEAVKIKADVPLLILDEINEASEIDVDLPVLDENDLEKLAFVSYSSGTTGKPKGIANPHRAAVNSYNLRFEIQDVKPGDRVACNVFFIWEILRPLIRGATVVAVPDDVSYDPAALVELLAAKRITETLMTPTLLATILSRHAQIGSRLPDLRTLWFNGEVVTTDLVRRAIKALPNTRLLNCYSTCEAHEIACGDLRDIFDEKATYSAVGLPLYPKLTYILDEEGKAVKDGESGELFVGGPQLARGYLNLPETTAKTFIPDPFNPVSGALMNKTGDRARRLPSGVLEITGRVGAMIKLRGYSVVPAKVENDIIKLLAVSTCVVIPHGEGLERQLVAYIVRDKDHSQDRLEVEINEAGNSPGARRVLSSVLAHYMIPAVWVELDELPTNDVSGKVDLKRLPPPHAPKQTNGIGTVRDSVSIDDIVALWAVVLKTSKTLITPTDNFFDLGGHSLSLADLSSRLSKHFGFRVPIARLAEVPTLKGHLEVVRDVRDGHTAAVQADLPAILRADSALGDDFQPSNLRLCPVDKAENILLTGVTGFLGPFLLHDLLESTSAKIICLVRFNNPDEEDTPAGGARIRRNLLELGLWNDSIMERVEILSGNLSRTRFGLSPESYDHLASRVQVIVHAAAAVNLVYPYAALRSANVGGTREILRLALHAGATVQYVSTNGVLPPSEGKGWDEDKFLTIDEVPEKLLDGYGQTKWVAEQLVLEAGRRGLPVKIHRAGTISSHSATGACNPWDLLTALIVESIQIGYAPDVSGWRAEMTPVDFTSKAIVYLANRADIDQTVFHLGDPNPVNIRSVFDDLRVLGYPTERINWDDWVALWTEKRGSLRGGEGAFTIDILRSGMPSIDFLEGIVVLDNAKTRPFRIAVERPKVDSILLETYTRHWFARGWLSHPPTRNLALGGSAQPARRGPLSGKVAVITGASSGIGAAVAVALAKEGCHVALGARRVEALEAVKRKMVVREGKVLVKSTDVTSKTQVEDLIRAARDRLGPVDILVSCAGVMYFTMMANNHTEDWERTVDVNCKGLLNCLSSTVPNMLSQGRGHIVAISSDAGRKVFPGLGVYSASKFFVEATLQALRLETAGTGLRVTSVQPGNTATELLGMSTDAEAIKKYGEPTGAKILDPEDVANSIVYALRQPEHVSVNEVLIEPRDEPI
ncbi:hybrid NRPS/PKS enzyme [Penicillium taxi]|uniref:hybrid NRPS/PKS enzyme n=1 Tax=Penicillium taxi TaxID=168475 RepID=UPI002544E518|nr:hybrid NRPS/PKS enzyme [Penicillium taxi]KAJ5895614.1 hybrid NRPS/PKS enzyme [Penicillium taxi]